MAVSGIGAAGAVAAYTITPSLATASAATLDLRNISESSASVASSTLSPAVTVTLGNPVTPDVTYGKPVALDPVKLIWATPPTDDVSRVSQQTEITGIAKSTGLSVAQTQSATLVASYEQSRDGAMLDTTNGSYDLYRIDDSTSTTTSFAYANAKLKSASVVNQVDQSEVHEKLVNHKVVERTSTPLNILNMQDISALLRPTA